MPEASDIELSLIIPAYNESAIILRNVRELESWMVTNLPAVTFEIIVVDDGSTDGMGALLMDAARDIPRLRVARHGRNRGRGKGVRTGLEASRGRYMICLDADLSYAPDHIPRLLEPLKQDAADITLASAYHPGGQVSNVPFTRAVMSRWGNRMLSAGFKGKLKTVTCVVRGFRRDVVEALELTNDGKDLHLEILQKAELFGMRILEVPAHLNWRDRDRGKVARKRLIDYIPFLSMSGTIASHLVYSYVLQPSALLNIPIVSLLGVSFLCLVALVGSWISRLMDVGAIGLGTLYSTLRETMLQGQLTVLVLVASFIIAIILLAFYFASQQSKRHHDDMYILLNRMNARLKELEQKRGS